MFCTKCNNMWRTVYQGFKSLTQYYKLFYVFHVKRFHTLFRGMSVMVILGFW